MAALSCNAERDVRTVNRRQLLNLALELRRGGSARGVPLLGISGIDGSGKSTLAAWLSSALMRCGVRVAALGVDDWHNPPQVRFSEVHPGVNFFENGLRLSELAERLLQPLQRSGNALLTMNAMQSADRVAHVKTFEFSDIELILLEGVFIFRRELQPMFDLSVWVDCPFPVALHRALRRNQEGLAAREIRRDYERIYFPAQRYHLHRDAPREFATLIVENGDT